MSINLLRRVEVASVSSEVCVSNQDGLDTVEDGGKGLAGVGLLVAGDLFGERAGGSS